MSFYDVMKVFVDKLIASTRIQYSTKPSQAVFGHRSSLVSYFCANLTLYVLCLLFLASIVSKLIYNPIVHFFDFSECTNFF